MRHASTDRPVRPMRGIAVLGALMLLAGSAGASVTYPLLYGVWARGDGIDVDVPFVGRAVGNCDFLLQGQNRDRATGAFMTAWMNGANVTGAHPSVYTGTIVTTTTTTPGNATNMNTFPRGFMVNQAANYGCLSGNVAGFMAPSHAAGATITLPTNLLSRPSLMKLVAVPIPGAPGLIQAATDADWFVPHSMRVGGESFDALNMGTQMLGFLMVGPTMRAPANCSYRVPTTTGPGGGVACTNLPPLNRLKKSAWRSQSGRAGKNFTWCPGAPGCVTLNGIGATDGMVVKYKAGPNRFGGTIAQIVLTKQVGSLFVRLGEGGVDVQMLDAGNGAIQATGVGYAHFLTDYLKAASMAFTTVYVGKHYKSTIKTSVTLIESVGATQPPAFPAGTNRKWGFPLTTGTVVVRNTNAPAVGDPVVTITGMGYDKLMPQTPTASGNQSVPTPSAMSRNISLVAGAVANLAPILNVNTSAMGQLFLPEPRRTGQLLAGVLGLLAVAAWRARAQRR